MSGSVESQAVYSMNVAQSWDVFQTKGAGVKIGVLSDSFDNFGYNGYEESYARDISTGDLPDDVQVLEDYLTGVQTDEGRAMLQLIYDIAPDADLAFYTPWGGSDEFAEGIRALAAAGCNVIVDDVAYFTEPFYMDGVIAQAVEEVENAGVLYFSSIGNSGSESAYESAFVSSGVAGPDAGVLHDFDPSEGVDTTQTIVMPYGGTGRFVFQWDQPFSTATQGAASCQNDLNIYLYDQEGNLVAESADDNIGGNPVEIMIAQDLVYDANYELVISLEQGESPGRMKWINWDDARVEEYATDSPSAFGHAAAEGAVGVAASPWNQTPAYGVSPAMPEDYSTDGPVTILFDEQGNRLESAEIRQQPLLTGPDGCSTTFFGSEDMEGNFHFYGTSASAPNVAAVAALMRSVMPAASNDEIISALAATALDMNDSEFDYVTGYGLVQADDALAYLTQGQDFAPVYEVSLGSASLWTDNRDEKISIISDQVWSYDGIGFGEAVGNDVIPTYRFYSATTNDHFLTTSASERDNVLATMSELYAYEGESFSVYASEQEGSTELYRFCNPQNMLHVYTADVQEYNELLAQSQFNYEGVMGWVEPLMV